MPDTDTGVAADLITAHHHYSGLVHTEGRRLADVLADHNHGVLEMNQVTLITTGPQPAELKLDKILVKKDHVLLAMPKGSYEAPIRRNNNYQKKERHDAIIVLASHVLSCVVYVPTRMKPWTIVDREGGFPAFFGVTNVSLHSSTHGKLPTRCDTAILRCDAIESLELPALPLPGRHAAGEMEPEDVLQAIRELRGAT